jgi:ABC-2 type transport system ATP-binding protein
MENAIQIQNVTMRYGPTVALRDVSLRLEERRIYGLLGRNGAGKSTLINAITNRIIPTQGSVRINGMPAAENNAAQGLVYAMGEKRYMPDETRVTEFFAWTKWFYPGFNLAYAMDLAQRFKLPVKKRLKGLSTGYSTIAKLIAALATDAPYVLLDEPVLGLDANHRELFYRELLANYAENPRTFVLSTHLIEEISGIIEQVVVLHGGKVLIDKPADEVKAMGHSVSGRAQDVDAYCAGRDVLSTHALGGLKTASVLGGAGDVPTGLEITPLDLQQLFVRLTDAQEGEAQ